MSVAVPTFETTPDRLGREWRRRLAESELPVTVGPMEDGERRFVFDATMHMRRPKGMPWNEWESAYGPTVNRDIDEGTVLVASGAGIAVGFAIVVRRDVLSMLYVKAGVNYKLRGNGVGLMLLEHARLSHPVTITAPTREWVKWAARHDIKWSREGE